MQLGFQEGVGCIEAFFVILETIICWNEGAKFSVAFLTFVKPPTPWIDNLLYKLFTELIVGEGMWLAIKDLYTGVKAQVLQSGSLSRQFSVSQGTSQGRILTPFMYKVHINALLIALSNHAYALNINSLSLPSPSFADGISLLAIQPSFLRVLMQMCYYYSLKWRYEFNNSKIGVVTFGLTRVVHCHSVKRREWIVGGEIVDELCEYKNLGVLKNCIGSFSSNVDDNIEKTRSKVWMIFSIIWIDGK